MTGQYFFAHGETEHGPYSADQMRSLATDGKIEPTDFVWQHGMTRRFAASRVQHLFEDAPDSADSDETDVATAEAEAPLQAAEEKPADAIAERPVEKPMRVPEKERPRRVVTIKGGVLVSQDGKHVQFRKKCTVCGYEEQGRTTQVIRPGAMKMAFFCRKCRKGRSTEMTGTT